MAVKVRDLPAESGSRPGFGDCTISKVAAK